MHAPTLKRTTLSQFVGLALALGLVASLALNVAMLMRTDDDAVPVTASQPDVTLLAKQQRYYDAKVARLDAQEAASSTQYVRAAAQKQSELRQLTMDRADWLAYRNTNLLASRQFFESKLDRADAIQARSEQRFAPTPEDLFVVAATQ